MSSVVRNVLAICAIWTTTLLAIALAGYFLATSGPIGDMAAESARTGVPVEDVARDRMAKNPSFLTEIQRSLVANDRFIDWIFLPALGAGLGAILGWTGRRQHRLYAVAGLVPFAAFVLTNQVLSGVLYVAIALVMAWGVAARTGQRVPK